jgi:hypothetical protein
MLAISCMVMCVAEVPAFSFARQVGNTWITSLLLAAAVGFLPHTFYAGAYMAETLQYPLFLTAFLLIPRWLDSPGWMTDLSLGFAMGCTILTKVQGFQLVSAFLVTLIAHVWCVRGSAPPFFAMRRLRLLSPQRWLVHGSPISPLRLEVGHWTWRLSAAYLADFLLAPGLITLAPLIYWVWAQARGISAGPSLSLRRC